MSLQNSSVVSQASQRFPKLYLMMAIYGCIQKSSATFNHELLENRLKANILFLRVKGKDIENRKDEEEERKALIIGLNGKSLHALIFIFIFQKKNNQKLWKELKHFLRLTPVTEMETSSHIPVFLSLQSNLTLALALAIDKVCFVLLLRSSETIQVSDSLQARPKMPYILFLLLFLFSE